jgi:FkbM family methyltransferase
VSSNPLARTLVTGRRAAGRVKRRLFPTPEEAAWRKLAAEAWRRPRYTPGVYDLMGYKVNYVDLLTVAPQWKDTFVDEVHAFESEIPNPRILDCGANVGIVTFYFKRQHPGARITAFEADPAIASALSRNVEQNALSHVNVVAAAVWDETGETTFVAEGADSGGIASEYRGESQKRITVPTIRLRDVIAGEDRIDLLKLDMEGAEHRVLADCEPELPRVRAMIVELHDFDVRERKNPSTLELLKRAGFVYGHGGVIPVPATERVLNPQKYFHSPPSRWVERVYAWRP